MNKTTLLKLRKVSVSLDEQTVLNNVSLEIPKGKITLIIGPNGSGKTTLMKILCGQIKISKGNFRRVGIKSADIAYVPQANNIFPSLTVKENLVIGKAANIDQALLKKNIDSVLEIFPVLKTRVQESAARLSGGQQQMLAIARGLITKPKLLLLDEPSTGLAKPAVKKFFEKIDTLNKKTGLTLVIIEHNLTEALKIADKIHSLK